MAIAATTSLAQQEAWLGADVSKNSFDLAVVLPGQYFPGTPLREVPVNSFPRTDAGAAACVAWARTQVCEGMGMRLVMEATGQYSTQLAQYLNNVCDSLQPAIVNPARTKWFIDSMGLHTKTDRSDARALAFYGAERRPAAYEALDPARAQLRSLSRYRDDLLREKVAAGNRQESQAQSPLVRKLQRQRLQQLERQVVKVEAEMKALVKRTPAQKCDDELMESIPGIAFLTASMMLGEVGDLRRFKRARQISSFIGASPRHHDSGTSVHGRPRMSKQGNSRVRAGLFMAAMAATRMEGRFRDDYLRMIERGKPPMTALGAIMRKLLVVMRAVVISGVPYDPCHKPAREQAVENFGENLRKTLPVPAEKPQKLLDI